jgi:anthranilate synthase/aminodeoxychorismate synthase-like glutamine amidotransferase
VILLLDGGDALTGALAHALRTLAAPLEPRRAEALVGPGMPDDLPAPLTGLVLSGRPAAGPARDAVRGMLRAAVGQLPALCVGGGQEVLAETFGARLADTPVVRHGVACPVLHRAHGLFAGLEVPFIAARYHARVVDRASLPEALEVTAWTPEGEVMGLRHRGSSCWGVQFHPQSILTGPGMRLLENFLALCRHDKEVPR